MSDPIPDEESLSADLSALRSALREVRAPDDEPALRSAARARAVARAANDGPSAARPSILAAARARVAPPRRALALAVAATVAGVAVLVALRAEWVWRAERADRAAQVERVAASSRGSVAVTAMPAMANAPVHPAFRPIAFSRNLSSAESYSVVRVRLELASIAPGAGAPNAAIEADLLVGEDGLARAIRFDSADTLPVYAASSGERR